MSTRSLTHIKDKNGHTQPAPRTFATMADFAKYLPDLADAAKKVAGTEENGITATKMVARASAYRHVVEIMKAATVAGQPMIAPKARKPKAPTTRPERWADACGRLSNALDDAEAAVSDLNDLRIEYEEWQSNMPENLANSPLGEKLEAVTSINMPEIEELRNALSECEGADLPIGFGKD
jgi:hypothetical protein